jgi:sugar lactone lactonase YvrE
MQSRAPWITCLLATALAVSATPAAAGRWPLPAGPVTLPIEAALPIEPALPIAAALPIGEAGQASTIDGAFGTDVGPDGNLYVCLPIENAIGVFDTRTGRLIERIGSDRGVDGPDDVEVADDGSIYWTSPVPGTISMLGPDGTRRSQVVAANLNPITIRDDGRIYVAAAFEAPGLFEVDPELIAPPRVIIPDITGLNGFDFGPDGLLYSPDTNTGGLVRIDVDATPPTVEVIAPPGSFVLPGAVSFDASGVLHVMDAATGEVFRFDIATRRSERVFDVDGTIDNIAFDTRNNLYVSGLADGAIFKKRPRGRTRVLRRGGQIAPSGVAVAGDGSVLLADFFSVRRLALRRREAIETFYTFAVPGLLRPLTIDAQGDLALLTTLDQGGLLQILDTRTRQVVAVRQDFLVPTNAVFLGDDFVVAQLLGGNVVRASDGIPLVSGLIIPFGLATDGDRLFAGDYATGIVWSVEPGTAPVPVATGLLGPEGLAVYRDWLLVAEVTADRITAIDLRTGGTRTLLEIDLGALEADPPTGLPPFGNLNGIAVDAERGILYVASDTTNQVLAFRLLGF